MLLYHMYDVEYNTPFLFDVKCLQSNTDCRDYFSVVSHTNMTAREPYYEENYFAEYCDANYPILDLNSSYYLQASKVLLDSLLEQRLAGREVLVFNLTIKITDQAGAWIEFSKNFNVSMLQANSESNT